MSDHGKQSPDLKDSIPSFVSEYNNDKMVSVVNAISKSRILYKIQKRTKGTVPKVRKLPALTLVGAFLSQFPLYTMISAGRKTMNGNRRVSWSTCRH